MTQNKFRKDLNFGQVYEKLALNYFDFDEAEFRNGYFKEYDFSFVKNGKITKVEVKSDRCTSKTGNLCIEYAYNGNPSGIETTEADYWAYVVLYMRGSTVKRYKCYIIPTGILRELVEECRAVYGGDDYKSSIYLLPRDKIRRYRAMPVKKIRQ